MKAQGVAVALLLAVAIGSLRYRPPVTPLPAPAALPVWQVATHPIWCHKQIVGYVTASYGHWQAAVLGRKTGETFATSQAALASVLGHASAVCDQINAK